MKTLSHLQWRCARSELSGSGGQGRCGRVRLPGSGMRGQPSLAEAAWLLCVDPTRPEDVRAELERATRWYVHGGEFPDTPSSYVHGLGVKQAFEITPAQWRRLLRLSPRLLRVIAAALASAIHRRQDSQRAPLAVLLRHLAAAAFMAYLRARVSEHRPPDAIRPAPMQRRPRPPASPQAPPEGASGLGLPSQQPHPSRHATRSRVPDFPRLHGRKRDSIYD